MEDINLESLEVQVRQYCERCSKIKDKLLKEAELPNSVSESLNSGLSE